MSDTDEVPGRGASGVDRGAMWHLDGRAVYRNKHGAVGYVDDPHSNPGLLAVVRCSGEDAEVVAAKVHAALAPSTLGVTALAVARIACNGVGPGSHMVDTQTLCSVLRAVGIDPTRPLTPAPLSGDEAVRASDGSPEALARLAEIPPAGSEERMFWLEAAEQHGVEPWTKSRRSWLAGEEPEKPTSCRRDRGETRVTSAGDFGPDEVVKMVEEAGGEVQELGSLPDGSGFATASFPLPEDHWIYGSAQRPPMTMRTGTDHPRRREIEERIREAGRYAVRSATMSGKDDDFDPDALIQNLVVGFLGYHTSDGLTSMGPEDSELFDPKPVPPLFDWGPPPQG